METVTSKLLSKVATEYVRAQQDCCRRGMRTGYFKRDSIPLVTMIGEGDRARLRGPKPAVDAWLARAESFVETERDRPEDDAAYARWHRAIVRREAAIIAEYERAMALVVPRGEA